MVTSNDFLFLRDFDENIVSSHEWLTNVNSKTLLEIPIGIEKKYNDDYFVMILYLLWILSLNQNPIYNTDEIVGE